MELRDFGLLPVLTANLSAILDWTGSLTGLRLNEQGEVDVLDSKQWREHRGGPSRANKTAAPRRPVP